MAEVKMKEGWLERELEDIPHKIAFSHSPQAVWAAGMTNMRAPLSPKDAKLLRQAMTRRYDEWTGRPLWMDLNEDRHG